MNESTNARPPVIRAYRSGYDTYIVELDGKRVYETLNRVKAIGVTEYLSEYHAVTPAERLGK